MTAPRLIVLDRDGVLNRLVVHRAGRPPESPHALAEVEILPGVPAALRALTDAGFSLAIATNQPAAAKGEITRAELDAIHAAVVAGAEAAGARIERSFICLHRAEDGCECRKPRPGLLRDALLAFPGARAEDAWMVGDRATDVIAGQSLGFATALLGSAWPGDEEMLNVQGLAPSFRGRDLQEFVDFRLKSL
ncbi:MAG TPA: HAD-IIIA family hydrolase [Polyangiaceae bacterium]|nr:HAD-IIIA family hydrolase [Polyangiaceae bacterium]